VRKVVSPVLAEAAGVLSDQLRSVLARLAPALQPEADLLEVKFLARLQKLGYDVRQRRALASLTFGNAIRFLARGCPLSDYFEEVEYSGRRLAKLNLPPSAITTALAEYERLIKPVLRRLLDASSEQFSWARQQLQFCVMLTLNNSYYQVREAETQAFFEMFWAELKAQSLDELLARFLAILARYCRADGASLHLYDPDTQSFVARAVYGGSPSRAGARRRGSAHWRQELSAAWCVSLKDCPRAPVVDPAWVDSFTTCWSVPLTRATELTGVLQFAFLRPYDWLPREEELLAAAAERLSLAIEKAQLIEHLAAQEAKIRSLAEGMMHVEEAERRRVSRELHDQTGQDLLWIRLQMEMLENQLPDSESRTRAQLQEIRDMTERTIVEIRRLIAALSPAVLEQLGLAAAIRQLVTRFRATHPAKVKLHLGRLAPLPKQTEVIAYRLVQECLNNIAKHSQCQHVILALSSADNRLRLDVEDDGVGFHLEEALNKPGSFGLAGIRERVALLGGKCEVLSRPRGASGTDDASVSGTRIRVELPLETTSPRTHLGSNRVNAALADRIRPNIRRSQTDKVAKR
jgi:signal transduction histidine kinase